MLSEKSLALVTRCNSSHMDWQAIDRSFQAQTRASRMQLKAQIQSISKGSMTMMDYIDCKRSIVDSVAANQSPISDKDLIGYLLNGLDSSYAPFVTAFMMKT